MYVQEEIKVVRVPVFFLVRTTRRQHAELLKNFTGLNSRLNYAD